MIRLKVLIILILLPYIKDKIEYLKPVHLPKNKEAKLDASLCTDVALVKLHPGIKPEFFDFLKNQYRGIVIESYGSGGIPFQGRNILEKLNELVECGISVVITTQCLEEGEDMDIYEVGRKVNQECHHSFQKYEYRSHRS